MVSGREVKMITRIQWIYVAERYFYALWKHLPDMYRIQQLGLSISAFAAFTVILTRRHHEYQISMQR